MSLTYGEIALRLIVSMVVGILLGEERKIRGKQVGTRTHALVCLAATFITMISAYGFADFEGSRTMDPARLVVGILTGIGFLGAGIIWRGEGGSLYGLTTAANIWMISAIGIGIGLGHFFLVGLTVVLVVITLEIGTIVAKIKSCLGLGIQSEVDSRNIGFTNGQTEQQREKIALEKMEKENIEKAKIAQEKLEWERLALAKLDKEQQEQTDGSEKKQ